MREREIKTETWVSGRSSWVNGDFVNWERDSQEGSKAGGGQIKTSALGRLNLTCLGNIQLQMSGEQLDT